MGHVKFLVFIKDLKQQLHSSWSHFNLIGSIKISKQMAQLNSEYADKLERELNVGSAFDGVEGGVGCWRDVLFLLRERKLYLLVASGDVTIDGNDIFFFTL